MTNRLTDRIVKDLPAPASGNRIQYDADLPGFGVRVTSAGARAFILNYRAAGRERRITIGGFPAWNVSRARDRAAELRRQVDGGADPMAERHTGRAAPTINDLATRYLEHAATRKCPRSLKEDKAMLSGAILPVLGTHRVADVHRSDVERLFRDISKRAPVRANRVLSLLRRMMNLAAVWELRAGPNPATAIERNAEAKRDRYLDATEVTRLLVALSAHRNQQSANVIRLALLTGARRGELLLATWGQIDLGRGVWSKPASMTKQRKLHVIPLNGPALELLHSMKAAADTENARRVEDGLPPIEHLFPGYGANDAQGDLKRTWQAVCKAAEISNLRFHDLRHVFASFLASSGHNLPIIGQLLGHTQSATTARYAHLLLDPLRQASERVGSIISSASRQGAEVVSIPARRA